MVLGRQLGMHLMKNALHRTPNALQFTPGDRFLLLQFNQLLMPALRHNLLDRRHQNPFKNRPLRPAYGV